MTLQPVHENLSLLRECCAVLLDHAKSLVNILLDVRIWITRSDNALRSYRQQFALFQCLITEYLPYLSHAEHPGEQIPTGNDYRSSPVVQPVRVSLTRKEGGANRRLSEL